MPRTAAQFLRLAAKELDAGDCTACLRAMVNGLRELADLAEAIDGVDEWTTSTKSPPTHLLLTAGPGGPASKTNTGRKPGATNSPSLRRGARKPRAGGG